MWSDHPLSQRNKSTERTVGVGVLVAGKRAVLDEIQNLKKRGDRQYRG